jgi:HEAT repeat protein
MSRKTKTSTSEKKHSAVPPKAVAPVAPVVAVTAPAAVVAPVTPVAAKAAVETKATPTFPSIEPMLGSLRDVDADVAREAATALGQTGNPAAVLPLIDVLKNSNGYFHSVVRSAAAAGLAQLKDSRAVEVLIEAVNDPITDPSTEAIHALAAIGDRKAVARLIEVTKNEKNFYAGSVRRAAITALIKLGGETAATELHRLAGDANEDPALRQLAGSSAKTASI